MKNDKGFDAKEDLNNLVLVHYFKILKNLKWKTDLVTESLNHM